MEKDDKYNVIIKEECTFTKWGKGCIFSVLVQYLMDAQKLFINRNNAPWGKLSGEMNYIFEGNQQIREKDRLGASLSKNQGNTQWTFEFCKVFWMMNSERIFTRTRS
jgi:hypothetical protein